VVSVVAIGDSDNLQTRKGLDRFLEMLNDIGRGRSSCTYPSKSQGHLKHEMGTEYDQEIPRRILRDGFQNTWGSEI